jgi:hypothetical protein
MQTNQRDSKSIVTDAHLPIGQENIAMVRPVPEQQSPKPSSNRRQPIKDDGQPSK